MLLRSRYFSSFRDLLPKISRISIILSQIPKYEKAVKQELFFIKQICEEQETKDGQKLKAKPKLLSVSESIYPFLKNQNDNSRFKNLQKQ